MTEQPLTRNLERNFAGPIRIPKTAEIVASRIREKIIRGELKDGDKLAAEAELTREFGVSRPTIREAIRILESERLISISRGARAGAEVHQFDEGIVARYAGYYLQSRRATLAEVYETRMLIEPPAARLVAEQHTAEQVAALRAAIAEQTVTILDPAALSHAIAMFHLKLVEFSGRHTLTLIFKVLLEIIERHQTLGMQQRDPKISPEIIRKQRMRGVHSMEKLVDLIEAGREEDAEQHWRQHMRGAIKVWLASYPAELVIDLLD